MLLSATAGCPSTGWGWGVMFGNWGVNVGLFVCLTCRSVTICVLCKFTCKFYPPQRSLRRQAAAWLHGAGSASVRLFKPQRALFSPKAFLPLRPSRNLLKLGTSGEIYFLISLWGMPAFLQLWKELFWTGKRRLKRTRLSVCITCICFWQRKTNVGQWQFSPRSRKEGGFSW